jgi:hypothetical protein
VDGCADFASYFDFAAGVVDAVGNCGLGAIFIDDCGGLRKGVWVSVGIGNVISPVWAAIVSAELAMRSKNEEVCGLSMVEWKLRRRTTMKSWHRQIALLPCSFRHIVILVRVYVC